MPNKGDKRAEEQKADLPQRTRLGNVGKTDRLHSFDANSKRRDMDDYAKRKHQ